MVFAEEKNDQTADIVVPGVFFDQILPTIDPRYAAVWLYAYAKVQSGQADHLTNVLLSEHLSRSLDEILEAWDFLESCRIIRKHKIDQAPSHDYSVELCDLRKLYAKTKKTATISAQELIVLSKNEDTRRMFDSIETVLDRTLTFNEMRSISEFIAEYGVNRELVAESFSFAVTRRKSKTVSAALSVLRTWFLDGIRTLEDLHAHLEMRDQRYSQYRQILSYLGEYRIPTRAEEKMMNRWLEEMHFSLEVIQAAFERSIAIKNPNMNYVNGILQNWHKAAESAGLLPSDPKDPPLTWKQIEPLLLKKPTPTKSRSKSSPKVSLSAPLCDDALARQLAEKRRRSQQDPTELSNP